MSKPIKTPKPTLAVFAWVAALFLLASCAVRLVSPYDETMDRGISNFHEKVTAFVVKMESVAGRPEGTYDANKDAYADLRASVVTLRMRAAATPLDEATRTSLDEVIHNIDNLVRLHSAAGTGGLKSAVGDPALAAIDVQCESILRFEIAKKRGDN